MIALPTNAVKFSSYNVTTHKRKLQSAGVIAKLKPALPLPKSPLLPILPTIFSIRLYSSMSRFTCRKILRGGLFRSLSSATTGEPVHWAPQVWRHRPLWLFATFANHSSAENHRSRENGTSLVDRGGSILYHCIEFAKKHLGLDPGLTVFFAAHVFPIKTSHLLQARVSCTSQSSSVSVLEGIKHNGRCR